MIQQSARMIQQSDPSHHLITMDELTLDDFKTMVHGLLLTAACDVCDYRLKQPVTLCNNCHAFCVDCKPPPNTAECPICDDALSLHGHSIINQMLEQLPIFCGHKLDCCPGGQDEECTDKLPLEDLKATVTALQGITQCPVCYDPLKRPATVCVNGHAICPDCKLHILKCPICKDDFSPVNPRKLHEFLNYLPGVCPYKSTGCPVLTVEWQDHDFICGYRPVSCKICSWQGRANYVITHVNSDHGNQLQIGDFCDTNYNICNFNFCINSDTFVPILAFDQLFWQHLKVDLFNKQLTITYHVVPNKERCDKYKYVAKVKLKKGDFSYTYSAKISEMEPNIYFKEEYCMAIPLDFFHSVSQCNKGIEYSNIIMDIDMSKIEDE